jgi:hypothetical protein
MKVRLLVVGVILPIRSLLVEEKTFFSPEDITALATAFEDTLRTLRLADHDDPIALMVAKKIIELAKQGEHNPERLRALVISQFEKRLR